mmetsp:Transcript_49460/g.130715  ORF Transcript_49460/g.130715 Transcript_49460/m.130715 type:complete len:253 (-) Transcript_49460:90-848(-)
MQIGGNGGSSRTVWMGQEFVDHETQVHVKRVIISAGVMAAIQVAAIMLSVVKHHFSPGYFGTMTTNIVTGLALPAIGFYGATRGHARAMCCFCGTNLLCTFTQCLMLMLITMLMWDMNESLQATCDSSCKVLGCGKVSQACSCDRECLTSLTFCCHDFEEVCNNATMQDSMSCEDLRSVLVPQMLFVEIFLFLLIAPGIALSAYAWWHGMALWRRLEQGENLVLQGAVALSRSRHPPVGSEEEGLELTEAAE